jgi:hypothetical protein
MTAERAVYEAPKRYIVASVSSLALAILFLWVAIAIRSIAPEITADASAVTVHLVAPEATADGDR